MNQIEKRHLVLKIAWHFYGKWYTWGGDDPSGFDCSGLVIECGKAVDIFPRGGWDNTANGIWVANKDKKVGIPNPGDFVFWNNSVGTRVVHTEIVVEAGYSIGASGGGRFVRTISDAIKANAFIKVRPYLLKPHLAGFIDPYKE